MTPDLQRLMQEATRLTQAGDLTAATAAIQQAMIQGGHFAGAATASYAPAATPEGTVIDVDAHEVPGGGEAAELRSPARTFASSVGASLKAAARRATGAGAKHRNPPRSSTSAKPPEAGPDGERFISGHHGAAQGAGGRDYKLYIPPQAGTKPLPLVVMLHGCTQDPDDFAAGTAMNEAAREQGFFVLYPAQSARVNPQRCWNWFKHSHQQRGRGEPALLAAMVQALAEQHGIDRDRVYVAGLSAGGAMAAILGETYPDVFAAVGVHSGLAAGSASDLPSALAAMNGNAAGAGRAPHEMPTIVFHGDADMTVHHSNGEAVFGASFGSVSGAEPAVVHEKGGRRCSQRVRRAKDGRVVAEHWVLHGASHAWAGGQSGGSYTDARGPDATGEMLRFFFQHRRRN